MTEHLDQFTWHCFRPFVVAGPQPDRVPRVIVQHRQRLAPAAASHRKVSLEIPLPQVVRSRVLEPLHVRLTRSVTLVEPTVATQDRRDRAGRWHRDVLETSRGHE